MIGVYYRLATNTCVSMLTEIEFCNDPHTEENPILEITNERQVVMHNFTLIDNDQKGKGSVVLFDITQ